jgi:hypothetical protein
MQNKSSCTQKLKRFWHVVFINICFVTSSADFSACTQTATPHSHQSVALAPMIGGSPHNPNQSKHT